MSQVIDLCEDSDDNGILVVTATLYHHFHFPERDPR
jgi:hypothetical protein